MVVVIMAFPLTLYDILGTYICCHLGLLFGLWRFAESTWYNKDFNAVISWNPDAIELEAYAVKGMRKVHSKWSPVATTAWYRISLRECVIMGPSGEQVGLKRVRDHFIFEIS
jgi:hypothetical protein